MSTTVGRLSSAAQSATTCILFALPDSLTLVAGQSSLRLESYLFTREALTTAREHLTSGGTFTMYNYYRERWLVDRYAGTLAEVFGQTPCVDDVGAGQLAAITVSADANAIECSSPWRTAGEVPPPATDNHPFPYLREAGVPELFRQGRNRPDPCVLGIRCSHDGGVAATHAAPCGPRVHGGRISPVLETKNVVQFALLFGTTWFVNALVFGGVLLSVLAAIEVTRH